MEESRESQRKKKRFQVSKKERELTQPRLVMCLHRTQKANIWISWSTDWTQLRALRDEFNHFALLNVPIGSVFGRAKEHNLNLLFFSYCVLNFSNLRDWLTALIDRIQDMRERKQLKTANVSCVIRNRKARGVFFFCSSFIERSFWPSTLSADSIVSCSHKSGGLSASAAVDFSEFDVNTLTWRPEARSRLEVGGERHKNHS